LSAVNRNTALEDYICQNTHEGKLVMMYTIRDVHTHLRPVAEEDEFDNCTDYERDSFYDNDEDE